MTMFKMKLKGFSQRKEDKISRLEKKVGIQTTGKITKPEVKKGGRRYKKITEKKLPKLYEQKYPGEPYVSPLLKYKYKK